jgi:hypothetical protein
MGLPFSCLVFAEVLGVGCAGLDTTDAEVDKRAYTAWSLWDDRPYYYYYYYFFFFLGHGPL